MKKLKIGFVLIGFVILGLYIITGNYGLNNRNIAIYNSALNLQQKVDTIGFQNFQLKNYPVAFFDGKSDYVFYNGDMTKRKPVFPVFVGTTYKVDEHYEVFVPTVEKMNGLLSVINGISTVKNKSDELYEYEYAEEEHITTIWHEVFHAYQMTNYETTILSLVEDNTLLNKKTMEEVIVSEVDQNYEIREYYEQELILLNKAVMAEDIDEVKSIVLEYNELDKKRKALLNKEVQEIESYYELVEGTAYYVETLVYQLQYTKEAAYDYYVDNIKEYMNGSMKYYRIGMAKCLLLDRLDKEWKSELNFSCSLDELLIGSM
jgi:hypothetical protein